MRYAAVLFDLDGTLVDTEPLWAIATRDIARRHGVRWNSFDDRSIIGWSVPAVADLLVERGVPLSHTTIVDTLHDAVGAAIGTEPPWRDGALALLGAVHAAGVPCGLVTLTYRRLVDAVVAAAPDGVFQVIVAGDDVSRAKPAPDAYLAAARALGVDPRQCLVVEDSPAGVTSALSAGAHIVAVDPDQPVTAHPRVHLGSLAEVAGVLGLA